MKPGIVQMPDRNGFHEVAPRLPGVRVSPASSIHHCCSII